MEILEILIEYIKQENTDFAILIDGNWGSGKTYFVKNEFRSRIEKCNCVIEGQEEQYSLVYVSLYGLSSVDELQKRLFLEVNPKMKTKVAQIGGFLIGKVGGIFSAGIDEEDKKNLLSIFGGIPKQKILVFDDLERLSNDMLNEVLGFINSYTEHQGLKVIIIADEAKIKDKITEYERVKEKLIRFTFSYKPELEKIFPEFSKRYNDEDFQKLLLSQKALICQTFEKGNHKNLRTLRFALDLYFPIFLKVKSIKNIEDPNKSSILILFLYFLLTYSIEYKKGASKDLLQSLKELSEHIAAGGFGINFSKHFFNDEGTAEDKEAPFSEDQTFASVFEACYIENSIVPFRYYDFLSEFIHTGNLDAADLEEACLAYNKSENAIKQNPEYIFLDKFENCLLLEDNDFMEVYKSVLYYVKEGIYPLIEYQKIFEILINCQTNKVQGINVNNDTVELFKEGMQKSLSHSAHKVNIRSPRHFIDSPILLQNIRDYTIELNNSLLDNDVKNYAQQAFSLIKTGSIEDLDSYLNTAEIKGVSIFQEKFIIPEEFIEAYLELNNQQKKSLQETFGKFFDYYVDESSVHKMKPFLQRIHDLIIQRLPVEDGAFTISLIHARNFSLILNSIIDRNAS